MNLSVKASKRKEKVAFRCPIIPRVRGERGVILTDIHPSWKTLVKLVLLIYWIGIIICTHCEELKSTIHKKLNKVFVTVADNMRRIGEVHEKVVDFVDKKEETALDKVDKVVDRKLKKLKICSSSGLDHFSSRFLSEFSAPLCIPLSIFYSKSMKSGIFKKGFKYNPSYSRPISLKSIPCNVMESIIIDGIVVSTKILSH